MVKSSFVRRRLNTISIFSPLDGESKKLIRTQCMVHPLDKHLCHCSPDSMPGCSTESAQCQSAAPWCRAPAPHCHGQTGSAGDPPCIPDQDNLWILDKSTYIHTYKLTNLCVKWIIMEEVSAVKCLTVGLVKGNYILISSEYLNLRE